MGSNVVVPLNLVYVRGDSEDEIDKVFKKVTQEIELATEGKPHQIMSIVRHQEDLEFGKI